MKCTDTQNELKRINTNMKLYTELSQVLILAVQKTVHSLYLALYDAIRLMRNM